MVEIRVHGRGGQGVLPQARRLARLRPSRAPAARAVAPRFAERVGAPVVAHCSYGQMVVLDRGPAPGPDHAVVLDPTLPPDTVRPGLAPGGWIVLASEAGPEAYADVFPQQRIATVDADRIVARFGDGRRDRDLVHTALAVALARSLGRDWEELVAALDHPEFDDAHLDVALAAFRQLRRGAEPSRPHASPSPPLHPRKAGPGMVEGVPPCSHLCPAGNDVQGFLGALADERFDDALEVLLRTSPFPAICGRICPAPCMRGCARDEVDRAVDVREMERLAGDRGDVRLVPAERRDERVAVVGSGPAGLAAAYHLALRGYQVRLFEVSGRLGGTLRSGVPEFRLPGDVVDREIDRVLELGVEVVLGRVVDGGRLLELAGSHDAVLVATGLQRMEGLGLASGNRDEAVVHGVDFLQRVKRGGSERLDGKDVVVVGASAMAVDAARTAVRLGAASVRLVRAGRGGDEAVQPDALREAEEEGVDVDFDLEALGLRPGAGPAGESILRCRRSVAGADADPPADDGDVSVPCDRVILAAGRSPNLSIFPRGSEVREGEELLGVLPAPVFAVGDVATGAGTVADSVGGGRRAALRIHDALTGEEVAGEVDSPGTPRSAVPGDRGRRPVRLVGASSGPTLDPELRRTTFDEVRLGVDDPDEARRCLSCGRTGPGGLITLAVAGSTDGRARGSSPASTG